MPCIQGPSGVSCRGQIHTGATCKCESVRCDKPFGVMWGHGKWKGRGQIMSQALVLGEASSICRPNCVRHHFDHQVPLPSPSPLPPQICIGTSSGRPPGPTAVGRSSCICILALPQSALATLKKHFANTCC